MIEVIPRTSFTISLASGGTQSLVLAQRAMNTQDWVSGALIVLLHSKTFGSATATANVRAHNTFFDPNDPTVLWAISGGTAVAECAIANADAAPNLYVDALSDATIGPFLRCVLNFSQGVTTGSCSMEISVYLLGRDS